MTLTEAITIVTVAFAVVAGLWMLKVAFGIKMSRRASRKIDTAPVAYTPRVIPEGYKDPAPYDDGKPFNPDDVELTIFPADHNPEQSVK